jgi:alpha-tubulin suppressor-like RCC1 family protein
VLFLKRRTQDYFLQVDSNCLVRSFWKVNLFSWVNYICSMIKTSQQSMEAKYLQLPLRIIDDKQLLLSTKILKKYQDPRILCAKVAFMRQENAFVFRLFLCLAFLGTFCFAIYYTEGASARGTITVEIKGYSGPSLVDIRGPKVGGKVFRRSIRKTGRTVIRKAPFGRYLIRARAVSLRDNRAIPLRAKRKIRLSKKQGKRRVVVRYRTIFVAQKISAGREHTCALRPSGKVSCWGGGFSGQLGNDSFAFNQSRPVFVKNLNDAIDISAGSSHTCAIRQGGQAVCWGNGFPYGQLGDGDNSSRGVATNVVDLVDAKKISAGGFSSCAIRASGAALCWGDGARGQLGTGNFADRNTPGNVLGLGDATSISAGQYHACAIRQAGNTVCWGDNFYGELGIGSSRNTRNSPAIVDLGPAESVSSGNGHTCAIAKDRSRVLCWGRGSDGQLGNGLNGDRSVPVELLPDIAGARSVSSGGRHSCTVSTDGAAFCWGRGADGQLGYGGLSSSNSPVAVQGRGFRDISAGENHTCALRRSGEVLCWGRGSEGQLGNGSFSSSGLPLVVKP